jgi:hypothetical protein
MNQPAPAEQVRIHMATPDFFDVLGVPALFGRTLTEDDATATPEAPPAVLSYGFWRRRFSSDPEAVAVLGWHVLETNDLTALAEHVNTWGDLIDIELDPVVEDAQAADAAATVFGK